MDEIRNIIRNLRTDYQRGKIGDDTIRDNPLNQFAIWFDEALKLQPNDTNAMVLSTVTPEGNPSSRIVLLKDFSDEGFTFFTNYKSAKAIEIMHHPHVSLLFFWVEAQRQVRIDGVATKVSAVESDAYFASRPRESQLGAWASPQSETLKSKKNLLNNLESVIQKFEGKEIPRPPHWGGYVVKPLKYEFWQGRPGRLHDRFIFTSPENGKWKINRLAP